MPDTKKNSERGGEKIMAEEVGETQQPTKVESVGRIEPDPANPELKRGTISLKFFISSDGFVYNNRKAALQHEEVLRGETRV